ncbi:hypothetical protein ABH922_003035 [Rhodococcus sp. 27YEA15]|uniref:WhiB family transcriptional regulator n=1 Tax=Rhodococcus sp. 27YEA15 TaxID=3156259 RepID=UPI003C7AFBDB
MTSTYLPLLNLLNGAPWTEEALCARTGDYDAVFPTRQPKPSDPVILTCGVCPVIGQCAAEAVMASEPYGIRAGVYIDYRMTRSQRARLVAIAEAEGVELPDSAKATPPRPLGGATAMAAKTHCTHGHEFTDENTGIRVSPGDMTARYCKTCQHASKRKSKEAKAKA